MIDKGRVIQPLKNGVIQSKEAGLDVMLCSTEIIENVIDLLEHNEAIPIDWLESYTRLKCMRKWHDIATSLIDIWKAVRENERERNTTDA